MLVTIDKDALWLDPEGICFLHYTPMHHTENAEEQRRAIRPAALTVGWLGGQKWELIGRTATEVFKLLSNPDGPMTSKERMDARRYEDRIGKEQHPTVS